MIEFEMHAIAPAEVLPVLQGRHKDLIVSAYM